MSGDDVIDQSIRPLLKLRVNELRFELNELRFGG